MLIRAASREIYEIRYLLMGLHLAECLQLPVPGRYPFEKHDVGKLQANRDQSLHSKPSIELPHGLLIGLEESSKPENDNLISFFFFFD